MSESESRERLLAAAKALVLAGGYNATTVDQICDKAGLTKGSFYHFFKSKEELGLAVLDWSLKVGTPVVSEGPYLHVADPVERAFAFLEHLENCSEQLWRHGCLHGSMAMELAATNDRMQATVSRMFGEIADMFADQLRPIVDVAPPGTLPDAGALARQVLALIEGAIVLAKAHRDSSLIPSTLRQFRQSLAFLALQQA